MCKFLRYFFIGYVYNPLKINIIKFYILLNNIIRMLYFYKISRVNLIIQKKKCAKFLRHTFFLSIAYNLTSLPRSPHPQQHLVGYYHLGCLLVLH